MMSSYKINYDQLRQQPEIAEMLSALERGFEKFGIDFYLVGAVARDVWMRGINKIAPRRTTGDIDFAILINDKGVYEALTSYLVEKESFQSNKENAFVLLWKEKIQLDLLLFGDMEDGDGKVTVKGTGFTSVDLPGFSEVYAQGLPEMELGGLHRFKFCTMPGIVLLKLIAWNDRPEIRRDDIKDISDILHHFFSMYDNEIWEHHADLFERAEDNLQWIAARVMGREMKKIAMRNEKLFARVEGILNANTVDLHSSRMAAIMVEYFANTVEENVQLLQHLRQGFIE